MRSNELRWLMTHSPTPESGGRSPEEEEAPELLVTIAQFNGKKFVDAVFHNPYRGLVIRRRDPE